MWISLLLVAVVSSLSGSWASPIAKIAHKDAASDGGSGSGGSITTYDQRQTGKYNVHVNIKDVQVFSISDSLAGIGGDYESEYGDYALPEEDGSDYGEFGLWESSYNTF